MNKTRFEWDEEKDAENQKKHGIPFSLAQYVFADPCRVIAEDLAHSESEKRYFCFGEVEGGILTVRFTYRGSVIRIFGAGYWRKGKVIYEHNNQIHK
ncbi:MAG: BrnT family toxin [Nitrospirae bacterium]|nr:BrnT family toxin [Nitrospirota bacterium]